MHDWRAVIIEYDCKTPVQPGETLLIRDAASVAEIDELQQNFGFQLPDEFRSLYLQCDGFGQTYETEDEVWWFFHRVEQIPDFARETRNWFVESHPDIANRFFPFIDWSNGDRMGYVLDEKGELLDGLFCFEHENYEFDEEQDSEEFIVKWNNSILELLTDGAGIAG